MKIKKHIGVIGLLSLSLVSSAHADDLYRVRITTAGTTQVFSDNDPKNLWDRLRELETTDFPGYVPGFSAAVADLDFRGVQGVVSFPHENDPTVRFRVPSAGIDETFVGATRSESVDLLVDYLKDNQSRLMGDLMEQAIAQSPVDPVAGNPASLMGRLVANAFDSGFRQSSYGAEFQNGNIFRAGIQLGRFNQGGRSIDTITVPLSYTIALGDGTPERPAPVLKFELPLTYMRISNEVDAYQGAFGIAYSHPITPNWRLTPSIQYGIAGSVEMKSLGHVAAANLTSLYRLPVTPFGVRIDIGNLFGYYRTLPVKLLGYEVDTNLANYVIKNGVMFSKTVEIAKYPIHLETYFTDIRFLGDDLYIDQYNEVGVAIKPADPKGMMQYVGVNLTYLFSAAGDDVNGGMISLSYDF